MIILNGDTSRRVYLPTTITSRYLTSLLSCSVCPWKVRALSLRKRTPKAAVGFDLVAQVAPLSTSPCIFSEVTITANSNCHICQPLLDDRFYIGIMGFIGVVITLPPADTPTIPCLLLYFLLWRTVYPTAYCFWVFPIRFNTTPRGTVGSSFSIDDKGETFILYLIFQLRNYCSQRCFHRSFRLVVRLVSVNKY